jgi:hypothetical protein
MLQHALMLHEVMDPALLVDHIQQRVHEIRVDMQSISMGRPVDSRQEA